MSVTLDTRVLQKLDSINWIYGDKDPIAKTGLEKRIADTGKKYGLISYSALVEGVPFNLPMMGSKPYYIQTYEWKGLDRKIIGEFLGYLNMESYKKEGIFLSALVVGKVNSKPSDIFFEWMENLGILPDLNEDTVLKFWTEEVRKAHDFYNRKPL